MSQRIKAVEFGRFRLDPAECLLSRDGQPVPLEPQVYKTLLALVGNAHHLSRKEWLMEQVWGDTHVEEGNLARNISVLRKALGEGYIETVPKRGYRFVARLKEVPDEGPDAPLERSAAAPATSSGGVSGQASRKRVLWAVATALVLAVVAMAILRSWTPGTPAPLASSAIRSIAILPFKQLDADGHDEALGLGMADTLITRVSALREVVVRPTSAVRKYTALDQDPVAAGRELNVDSVLDGSIQRSNDRLRVSVRLVNVRDGTSLWAQQFDQRAADIFAVQDAISDRVIRSLALALTGEQRARLAKRHTEDAEAYQLYINGRYHWNQRSETGLRKATGYFEQAIEKDPTYALAYSGLADAYTTLGYLSYLAPSDAFPKAKKAATTALQLDATLPEPHASLGYIRLYHDWDWTEAEREFTRAIALNPNYPTAHHWYGVYLTAMGRFEEAHAAITRARGLDPTSLIINTDLGFQLYYSRQYDAAIMQLRAVIDMNPQFPLAHLWLGRAYQERSMYERAIVEFRLAEAVLRGWPVALAAIGHAQGVSGRRAEARETLRELSRLTGARYVTPYGVALVHAGLGENARALAWLDRALEERSHWLVWLKLDPRFETLHSEGRFRDLLERVGLR